MIGHHAPPFTSFNPEPTATVPGRAVAVGSGLNERVILLLLLVLLFTSGCAITKPPAKSTPKPNPGLAQATAKVTPAPPEDRDKLIHDFEVRRDAAQLGSAFDRWKQGDDGAAETLLLNLLERSPGHREARRALADLYVARPDTAAALEQLGRLVEQDPRDPQAHHSLGLLLDSLQRRAEALRHFEEAVKLEPKNELYQLTLEGCRE